MSKRTKVCMTITGAKEDMEKLNALLSARDLSFQLFDPVPKELCIVDHKANDALIRYCFNQYGGNVTKVPFQFLRHIDPYGARGIWDREKQNLQETAQEKWLKCGEFTEMVERLFTTNKYHFQALGQQLHDNIVNHGAPTQNEWRLAHWGTSSDVLEYKIKENTPEKISLEFTSEWGFPRGAITAIVEQFPGVKIAGEYACEEFAVDCGTFSIESDPQACKVNGYRKRSGNAATLHGKLWDNAA